MAYNTTYDIDGKTGAFGYRREGDNVKFSQLFDGLPQYYPGSIVQVQEVMTIVTRIVDRSVVSVDKDWFQPKEYVGTYQLIEYNGVTVHDKDDDGYLVSTYQKISRYSWYTIVANPNVPIALDEGFIVEDCNFYTIPEVYLFPGTTTPVPGFRLRDPGSDKPILRGYTSRTAAPLADTDFYSKIGGVGLYLKPGIEGVRIEYRAAIINDIYTAYQPFPVSTCELANPSCLEQFNAHVATLDVLTYSSEAECVAAQGGICVAAAPWVCPTDPTQIFEQWSHVNGT